jgi:diaminohydroxyphosphoribosylaminopyrimidine deaminase/5-amino-6-(5-phosphoribosylamino)uracil reductase
MDRALDERLMRRAIELARAALGTTGDNPAVGCVIARGDVVLAEAATAPGGRPHAEEQALSLAGQAARGATAYVTLEPCAERSSGASSCSQLLVAAGLARVVIAAGDPSPKAAGRGGRRLRGAGVSLETGFLADEADPLYAEYRRRF